MKKNYLLVLIWILFFIFIFAVLLRNSYSYLDPDLGWHLKCGEEIYKTRSVPTIEHYDYTIEGQTWADHEWLSNLTSYLIYSNAGYLGLNIFFVLIVILTLVLLLRLTKKYFVLGKSQVFFSMLLITTGILMGSIGHLGVRMQEITLLFLVLLLSVIYGFNKTKNYRVLFWLLPIIYLWSCLHAGFLIGIFLLFFWAGVKFFEYILSKKKPDYLISYDKIVKPKQILVFLVFSLLSVISTLFTPYGLSYYSFLSTYLDPYYMSHIKEWLSPLSPPSDLSKVFYLLLFVAVLCFLILYVLQREKKYRLDLWVFLSSALFFFLAMKSARHFPLFFIISFPFFLEILSGHLFIPSIENVIKSKISRAVLFVCVALFYCLLVASFVLGTGFVKDPFQSFCGDYPCGAVDFMKKNPQYISYRIFNEYDWGGYMIWTIPEKKLFIDGRLPQFPYKGHSFLEEFQSFNEKGKIQEKIAEYGIKMFLLKTNNETPQLNFFDRYIMGFNEKGIGSGENEVLDYLSKSDEWGKIYSDDISVIYIKR